MTEGEFEKRAYTKEDVESLIKSRWKEKFVNMEDIKEAGKEFHNLLQRPYPKVKKMRQLVKRWFGDDKK